MSSPFAHASIGLFSKTAAPRVPLWALIAATQVPDVLFFIFEAAGLEHQAETQTSLSQGLTYLSPAQIQWSHGLMMCLVPFDRDACLCLPPRPSRQRGSGADGAQPLGPGFHRLQQPSALLRGDSYYRPGAQYVRPGVCGEHRHRGRTGRGRSHRLPRRSAAACRPIWRSSTLMSRSGTCL